METPDTSSAAGQLRAVAAWAERTRSASKDEIVGARDEVIARYQPVFAPESIPDLAEDEFKGFLLFRNNRHWGGIHRQGASICADMDLLRRALLILVDESQDIGNRLDQLVPKSGKSMVPGLGPAVITAILLIRRPDTYGVWNGVSEGGLRQIGILPAFERGAPFSHRYVAFNAVLDALAAELQTDLWTVDWLFWALSEYKKREEELQETETESEEGPLPAPAQLRFGLEKHLHEFMRDNWDGIELGAEWALYEEDGDLRGFEYNTGEVGQIDLLARHKQQARWLVIELKRSQSSDDTVGQVLRYMGWVKRNLAAAGEPVEGLIVARQDDARLHYALDPVPNVSLKLYQVDFRLIDPDAWSAGEGR